MSKTLSNVRHEAVRLEIIYSKLLEVFEGKKVVEGAPAEPFWSEVGIIIRPHADPEPFDKGK